MTEVIELSETWATIEGMDAARERRRQRQAALARRRRAGGDRPEAGCAGGFQPGRAAGAEGMVPAFGADGEGWEAVLARRSEMAREAVRSPSSRRLPWPSTGVPGPALMTALRQAETDLWAWERAEARPPATRVPDHFVVTGPVPGTARATAARHRSGPGPPRGG
jgi:hypothetical protein